MLLRYFTTHTKTTQNVVKISLVFWLHRLASKSSSNCQHKHDTMTNIEKTPRDKSSVKNRKAKTCMTHILQIACTLSNSWKTKKLEKAKSSFSGLIIIFSEVHGTLKLVQFPKVSFWPIMSKDTPLNSTVFFAYKNTPGWLLANGTTFSCDRVY